MNSMGATISLGCLPSGSSGGLTFNTDTIWDTIQNARLPEKEPVEAAMTYWVYVDDPTNRVRVHRGSCSYCNDGRGMKESRLPDNRWHGPYATEREAIDIALMTGRLDAKGCWFCLGEVGSLR